MRQEVFNDFIRSFRINPAELTALTKLYLSYNVRQELHRSNANPVIVLDGNEISLDSWDVGINGEVAIEHFAESQSAPHGVMLNFGHGLKVPLFNTWGVPTKPPLGTGDNEPAVEDRKDRRREEVRMERVDCERHMDAVDIQILRNVYSKWSKTLLDLMQGWWQVAVPAKVYKKFSVGQIVYLIGEKDLLNAAWEVRSTGIAGDRDIEGCHLMSGAIEPMCSGHCGTEQEWLKCHAVNTRMREQMVPTDEEKEFIDVARDFIERNFRPKDPRDAR
jgi:hypothetical protein